MYTSKEASLYSFKLSKTFSGKIHKTSIYKFLIVNHNKVLTDGLTNTILVLEYWYREIFSKNIIIYLIIIDILLLGFCTRFSCTLIK